MNQHLVFNENIKSFDLNNKIILILKELLVNQISLKTYFKRPKQNRFEEFENISLKIP